MNKKIKTKRERMRRPGKVAYQIFKKLPGIIEVGITGEDINDFIEKFVEKNYPEYNLSSKGYSGFPASACISINEGIVHGIPSERVIEDGDLVKVDIVLDKDGWYADTAKTYMVGNPSPDKKSLVKSTREALYKAIKAAKPGNTVGGLGYIIQNYIESRGFSVMRKYCGHGIGREMHMPPQVPNYGKKGTGPELKPGMAIAIEPMAFMGNSDIEVADDGWSVKSKDNSPTAHFEHTILITETDPVIITGGEKIK
ncbi:MAG: type I methionyl aminopeptidase [Elusimicrobiota bacterium]